jgi:chemotaxis protein CheC
LEGKDMPSFDLNDISHVQYDVLKELGNIGAGNATTALSKLINARIEMKVPKVQLLDLLDVPTLMGDEETVMVGILVMLSGEVNGFMMFLMTRDVARKLVNILMNSDSDSEEFSEIELSAIQEIGNIITGAYMSSLSDLTTLKFTESVPYMQIDMVGAILSVPAIEFGKIGDQVLLIETEFEYDIKINGYYILVPELESYDKILEALGVK